MSTCSRSLESRSRVPKWRRLHENITSNNVLPFFLASVSRPGRHALLVRLHATCLLFTAARASLAALGCDDLEVAMIWQEWLAEHELIVMIISSFSDAHEGLLRVDSEAWASKSGWLWRGLGCLRHSLAQASAMLRGGLRCFQAGKMEALGWRWSLRTLALAPTCVHRHMLS